MREQFGPDNPHSPTPHPTPPPRSLIHVQQDETSNFGSFSDEAENDELLSCVTDEEDLDNIEDLDNFFGELDEVVVHVRRACKARKPNGLQAHEICWSPY